MEAYTAVTPEKCIPQETVIENVKLARAYVPFEIRCTTFAPDMALTKGTIFPPLWDNYQRRKEGWMYGDE